MAHQLVLRPMTVPASAEATQGSGRVRLLTLARFIPFGVVGAILAYQLVVELPRTDLRAHELQAELAALPVPAGLTFISERTTAKPGQALASRSFNGRVRAELVWEHYDSALRTRGWTS